jgi:hypothetical protein
MMDSLAPDAIVQIMNKMDARSLCNLRLVSKRYDFAGYLSRSDKETIYKDIFIEKRKHVVSKILSSRCREDNAFVYPLADKYYSLCSHYFFEEKIIYSIGPLTTTENDYSIYRFVMYEAERRRASSDGRILVEIRVTGMQPSVVVKYDPSVSDNLLTVMGYDCYFLKTSYKNLRVVFGC